MQDESSNPDRFELVVAVVDFREMLEGRGYADRTIAEYVKWVRRAGRWAEEREDRLDQLTAGQLRAFADGLPRGRESRKQSYTALRHYYQWVGRTDEPWHGIRIPPKRRMKSRALSPEDAARMYRAALAVGGRQGLTVLCGLFLAARASELAALRWDGWDRKAGTFAFERTKVGDVHEVPVHPILAAELERARAIATSDYLFPGNDGRAYIKSATVWEWVRRVGRLAGIETSPHVLRHTALTTALDATRDLRAVQEFAGHADPAVTAGYTRITAQQVRVAVMALDYADAPAKGKGSAELQEASQSTESALGFDGAPYEPEPDQPARPYVPYGGR